MLYYRLAKFNQGKLTQPLRWSRASCDYSWLDRLLIVLAAAAIVVIVLAISNLLYLSYKRGNTRLNAEYILIINRASYNALCAKLSIKRLDYAIRVRAIPLY
jgi:hypothetical protein